MSESVAWLGPDNKVIVLETHNNGGFVGTDRAIPDSWKPLTDNTALTARVQALEDEKSERLWQPLGDNHHNAAACPYCQPKLSAHDEAVRRDALGQAWERVSGLLCKVLNPSIQAIKAAIFGIPPSTEAPTEKGK